MTQTCTTCHDDTCPKMGMDLHKCDHYIRLSDLDPEPEPASSSTDNILSDLSERVDLIAGQLQTMQMQWDDLWAAVLKVRAGEGL